MAEVASRELRNKTRDLILRAEQGELIVITVDGRPTAELRAIGGKRRWIPKDEFIVDFEPADPAMLGDIRGLVVETNLDLDQRDDLRWGNA